MSTSVCKMVTENGQFHENRLYPMRFSVVFALHRYAIINDVLSVIQMFAVFVDKFMFDM